MTKEKISVNYQQLDNNSPLYCHTLRLTAHIVEKSFTTSQIDKYAIEEINEQLRDDNEEELYTKVTVLLTNKFLAMFLTSPYNQKLTYSHKALETFCVYQVLNKSYIWFMDALHDELKVYLNPEYRIYSFLRQLVMDWKGDNLQYERHLFEEAKSALNWANIVFYGLSEKHYFELDNSEEAKHYRHEWNKGINAVTPLNYVSEEEFRTKFNKIIGDINESIKETTAKREAEKAPQATTVKPLDNSNEEGRGTIIILLGHIDVIPQFITNKLGHQELMHIEHNIHTIGGSVTLSDVTPSEAIKYAEEMTDYGRKCNYMFIGARQFEQFIASPHENIRIEKKITFNNQ